MADLVKAIISVETKGQQSLTQLSTAVGKTEQSLKKMTPATGQATSALINLGRVAQDAPFGIIGIANNLNPLLESFQRTAKEAGGFGGAMKALGASLLGGGGIGFALSLVTGAMSFFALSSNKAEKETKKLDEAAQKAAEAQRELQQALDAASGATVNQAGEIANLRSILVSTGTTLEALSQATLNQALTQYLFTQKRELLEKSIAQTLGNQLKIAKSTGENFGNFKYELEQATKTGPIRIATDEDWRRSGKGLTDIENQLLDINKIARTLGITFDSVFTKTFEKGGGSGKKKIEEAFKSFSGPLFSGNVKIEPPPDDEVKREATAVSQMFYEEFNNYLKRKEPIDVSLINAVNAEKEFETFVGSVDKIFNSAKLDGIAAFGEGIGQALSGGNFKDIFGNFLSVIGSGVQAIGKQILALSVTAETLKKALKSIFTNPALGIAAGVGLIAVGAAIKNLAGKGIAGARALGGPVGSGRTYLVGERGPELFTPGISGNIIPNGRLGSMAGSFGGGGTTTFVLRGSDLMAAMASTGRAQTRLI
jgi:hypothetical protein